MLGRRPIYIELISVKLDPLRHFQCLPAKWAVLNWDMGVTEGWNSRDDAFAYCESMCGTAECEELDVKNDWQCERNSFYGLLETKGVDDSYDKQHPFVTNMIVSEFKSDFDSRPYRMGHSRSPLNSVKDSSMVI